jgi:hypothetical protein
MSASYASTSYAPENLLAGDIDNLIGEKITVVSGQNLVRGTVIGKITASGKYTTSLSASTDGSQVPDFILAEDCNATAGEKIALAYSRGDFNAQGLTIGTGHTIASIKEGLRVKNIILINSIA